MTASAPPLLRDEKSITNISTVDLRTNPIQVSIFLRLELEEYEQAEGKADNGG